MNVTYLKAAYKRNLSLIRRDTAGVSEEAAHQRAGSGSSLNWTVGHILSSRGRLLHMLGAELPDLNAEQVASMYGNKTHPDPAHALSLAELLGKLEATQPALEAALDSADLTKETESPFGSNQGELLNFLAWHEGYHAGQVVVFRRLAGL